MWPSMRVASFLAVGLFVVGAAGDVGPDGIIPDRGAAASTTLGGRPWPCEGDVLWGQPARSCSDPGWSAHSSSQAVNYQVFEDFTGFSGTIYGISWWGLCLKWNGSAWEECDTNAMTLRVVFYPDNNGVPNEQQPFAQYTGLKASAEQKQTCQGFKVYYFSIAPLEPPCDWPGGRGWVSIQSTGDANSCSLLWISSATGNNVAYQKPPSGNLVNLGKDLGVCFAGSYTPVYGACCDDTSGICENDIQMLNCLGPGRRFAPGQNCNQLVPLCGHGACCYPDELCSITTADICANTWLGDANCDGAVDFNDINPFVGVLTQQQVPGCPPGNCDLNRDGAVDFNDISPFVKALMDGAQVIHGQWQGPGTTCNACPCDIDCPWGSTPEAEPCGSDTNGGCNSPDPNKPCEPIACGETKCGTLWVSATARDTDWYELVLTEPKLITVTGQAELDVVFGWVQQKVPSLPGCENTTGQLQWYAESMACAQGKFVTACLAPGTYYIFVAPLFGSPVDCPAEYWITVQCEPCTLALGACCKNGECYDDFSQANCTAMFGQWMGEGTNCYSVNCPTAPEGDICSNPFVVGTLPYSVSGNTCQFSNDYDEACPYPGWAAPDVVYAYVPASNITVDISLCNNGTNYDTKLYVYADGCPGTLAGCNDDDCFTAQYPDPYVSKLEAVALTAGTMYYIVVDGYSSDCGDYVLTIEEHVPCNFECPPGGQDEQEVCSFDSNGGCNMSVPQFEPIECGQTKCGTTWWDGTTRDTDWYELFLTESMKVTVAGKAEFKAVFGWVEQYVPGQSGCDNVTGYLFPYITPGKCVEGSFTTDCLAPGWYYIWVAADTGGAPFDCNMPNRYYLTVTCQPCTIIPCEVFCPPGGTPEGEPLANCMNGAIDNYNGGCNSPDPNKYQPIACGEVMCGTSGTFLFQGNNRRDTDWYEHEFNGPSTVTWDVKAEFPLLIMIIDADGGCGNLQVVDYMTAGQNPQGYACAKLEKALEAGKYWFWVGPSVFSGVPCGKQYVAELTCSARGVLKPPAARLFLSTKAGAVPSARTPSAISPAAQGKLELRAYPSEP